MFPCIATNFCVDKLENFLSPLAVLRPPPVRASHLESQPALPGARPVERQGPLRPGLRAPHGRRILLQHLRRKESPARGGRLSGGEDPVDGGHC